MFRSFFWEVRICPIKHPIEGNRPQIGYSRTLYYTEDIRVSMNQMKVQILTSYEFSKDFTVEMQTMQERNI